VVNVPLTGTRSGLADIVLDTNAAGAVLEAARG
jgi:hypothetical protein